ncbi:MAG: hypothetical protein JXA57_11145 [Armatimonadetes bacterium]|nr:hypothetical protein [Armatimonadota bacterium]
MARTCVVVLLLTGILLAASPPTEVLRGDPSPLGGGSLTELHELWQYPTNAQAVALAFGDINGNSKNDIMVSADPSSAKLYAVSDGGSLLWSKSFSGQARKVITAELDGDDTREVVYTYQDSRLRTYHGDGSPIWEGSLRTWVDAVIACNIDSDPLDEIVAGTWGMNRAWDNDGTVLWTYYGTTFSGGPNDVARLDDDQFDDFLIGTAWTDGRLHALDDSGHLIWAFQGHPRTGGSTGGASVELDADSHSEVIAWTEDSMFGLDHDGNVLWRVRTYRGTPCPVQVNKARREAISVYGANVRVYDCRNGALLSSFDLVSPVSAFTMGAITPGSDYMCFLCVDGSIRICGYRGEDVFTQELGLTGTAVISLADITADGVNEVVVGDGNSLRVYGLSMPPRALGDGIYIGQGDVYDTREPRLKSLLNEIKAHNFTELYLNVGNLDADGTLCWGDGSTGNPDKVKYFVEYFHNNYPQARLHAVLNGSTRGKPPVVRLGDPQIRQRISVECALALWYTGLHGVTFDIEPIASRYYVWPEPFEAKMSFFLATLDSVANRVPIERISTYGESWVDDTRFLFIADVWSVDDYPLVKEHCDHVIDMAYNNLSTDDTPYGEWMTEQTAGIAERIPEGGFSIAVPSFNWAGGGHNPRRHTLQNALLGVKAAIPATAKIHVWNCPSMDVEDPFCGENEWLVFDRVWNMNALQDGVRITDVTPGPLKPHGGNVDIQVKWQTENFALHTDIHWSRVETNQDTYPSGQGSTWSGSGEFVEVLQVPEPPTGKRPYTICLVAHAYCGVANRYSEPKYVSVSYNGGDGQGSEVVVSPAVNACEGSFPDPFSTATRIRYCVGGNAGLAAPVLLSIVDRAGRVVRQLVNRPQAAGFHSATWDGRDDAGRKLPAGVYLYRLSVGEFTATRKMVKSE